MQITQDVWYIIYQVFYTLNNTRIYAEGQTHYVADALRTQHWTDFWDGLDASAVFLMKWSDMETVKRSVYVKCVPWLFIALALALVFTSKPAAYRWCNRNDDLWFTVSYSACMCLFSPLFILGSCSFRMLSFHSDTWCIFVLLCSEGDMQTVFIPHKKTKQNTSADKWKEVLTYLRQTERCREVCVCVRLSVCVRHGGWAGGVSCRSKLTWQCCQLLFSWLQFLHKSIFFLSISV